MLEMLFKNISRTQVYCTMTLKCLMQLCLKDNDVFEYVVNLPAPSPKYPKYVDFFGYFVQTLLEDAAKYFRFNSEYPTSSVH